MGYIICILLVAFGFYVIHNNIKEKTGCGCLGVVVAGLLFILIVLARVF